MNKRVYAGPAKAKAEACWRIHELTRTVPKRYLDCRAGNSKTWINVATQARKTAGKPRISARELWATVHYLENFA